MPCSRSPAACAGWLRPLTAPAIGALLLVGLHAETAATTAVVSCPAVPPGGTAQITIMLSSPVSITHGKFHVDLDPAVFGDISAMHIFSASGDQQGVAKLQGQHADVVFDSNSGGIGRLPNVPVAEITVPVIDTAPAGGVGAVVVQAFSPWREVSGRQYTVSFQSPGVAIGAGLSIQSVVPGGGQLAAGTLVEIRGQGFTSSTRLRLDGVARSDLQFVSSSLLTFALTGATDLTGKLLELSDENDAATRYYSNLTPASIQDDTGHSGYWPIFPAVTYRTTGARNHYLWFENDTPSAIDVMLSPLLFPCTPCRGFPPAPTKTITVPAGGLYFSYYNYSGNGSFPAEGTIVNASAPIRVLSGLLPSSAPLPDLSPTALSPFSQAGRTVVCDAPAVIDYRVGDAPPQPVACEARSFPVAPLETLTAGTDDGNPWLQASAVPGSTTKFTVSVDPAGLALGSHLAVVSATVSGAPPGWGYTIFKVTVHEHVTIAADYDRLYFDLSYRSSQTLKVTSSSPSVPITISSSDTWLTVTPTSATTPATLAISVAPSTGASRSATITIRGPENSLTILVSTEFSGFLFGNQNIRFAAKVGDTSPLTSTLRAASPFDLKIATDSGGNWLSAVALPPSANSDWTLTVKANPSSLAAGLYHGTVNATPKTATAFGPASVPVSVTLSVWSDPDVPPAVSPASLELSQSQDQLLSVSTGSVSLPFSVTYAADDGLTLVGSAAGIAPASVDIYVRATYPGTYHGSVTITAPPGSANAVTVPVTVTALPNPIADPNRPKISAIVNAGSILTGSIAPGEIVSVFGNVSSAGTAGATVGTDGKVNRSHYGNRVLFNGVAAPLTYMSATRIEAAVPYEIAGSPAVTVEIDGGGVHSAPWIVPVAASAPGLFTQNGSGQGDGSILNQDGTSNTPHNPASRGSIVQIFLTGEGATSPAGITGEVTRSTKTTTQPLSVQMGGMEAKVLSATAAPNTIAGVFQVNAMVPAGSPAGSVLVLVRIGDGSSQSAVTLSVE